MSKYIHLTDRVWAETGTACTSDVEEVLRWLDRNLDHGPDQVPGRTMVTKSQVWAGMKAEGVALDDSVFEYWASVLGHFDITVAPEPTEAEKLAEVIEAVRKKNRGFSVGDKADSRILAEFLAEQGVKAPEAGGNDG